MRSGSGRGVSLADEIHSRSETARVRKERDAAVHEAAQLRERLDRAERALSVVAAVESAEIAEVEWLRPAKPRPSAATLMLMLSDTHFDEVVIPSEVDGLNAYSREIARLRLHRWGTNAVKMARHYLAGVRYDGCVLLLGGDIFSGDIHEELAETNEDTMIGSLLYWAEELAGAIEMLRGEFRRVHVASVVGNHGRTTRKPRAKLRAKTNFDYLLAKIVERHFRDVDAVTFTIPDSTDVLVPVYGFGHLMTHGDQATGGSGIGGIWPPIMRLRARKAQRFLATDQQFSTLWCGHWHQYTPTPTLIVNGSMKGLDEYAFVNNFGFEPPQQALAVVAPTHGITVQAPVFCADRKREGW